MLNKYEIRGAVTVIYINSGEGQVLIDTEDLPKIARFNGSWCFSNERKNYASITLWHPREKGIARKYDWLLMHRVLSGPAPDQVVDHINGNGLDNRKYNLRNVSNAENMQNLVKPFQTNKSGVIGVSWHSKNNCWIVQISIDGVRTNLGSYDSLEEAERVSLSARAKYYPFSKEARYQGQRLDNETHSIRERPNRNNKSGHKNIGWRTDIGKWHVQIQKNKKKYHIGLFEHLEDAVRALEDAKSHGNE